MKILQINTVYGNGSTGRIVNDIHTKLLDNGDKSFVIYGRNNKITNDQIIKIFRNIDTYLHVLKTRLIDKHGFGSKNATQKIIKKIHRINPDLIHLHNVHGYYINIEILFEYLKKIKKPIIWTLHDCWSFTGHCSHFDKVGCEKWKSACFECPLKNEYPKSIILDNSKINYLLKKELFTGLDNLKIVVPSKWLSKLVKQSFLKEYFVNIINNGVDLSIFRPTTNSLFYKNIVNNKFVILGVANVWSENKGLSYFFELSMMLSKDEVIILVGLNQKQMLNLPKNIIGFSKTNSAEELSEIYSNSDVFVNPTLEDTFPTVNLEALASGTPVITFNTGGSVETIDENTGIVTLNKSAKSIYESIIIIKEKGKSSFTAECRKRALNFYNKQEKYSEYIKLYKNTLSSEI